MSQNDKGFAVKDRRIFSADEPAPERSKASEPPPLKAEKVDDADVKRTQAPLPQINFPTFIASLNASALVHLGIIEDPVSGKAEKNLPMAIARASTPLWWTATSISTIRSRWSGPWPPASRATTTWC